MSPATLIAASRGLFPTATALAQWAQDQHEPRLHDIGEALECAALSEDAAAVIELEDALAEALGPRLYVDAGDWFFCAQGRGEE